METVLATAAAVFMGNVLYQASQQTIIYNDSAVQSDPQAETDKKKRRSNTNPFDGPVDEPTIIGDEKGNNIYVDEGNRASGSRDGKWVQVNDAQNKETGTRLDQGHPPGPKHPNDSRAWEPHAHVPGVANPDGTTWLPVKQ